MKSLTKKLWVVIPALLVIAGMVLTGCPNGSTDDDPKDITWTLSADGAGDTINGGTVDTTKVTITFNKSVANLRGQDVTLEGPVDDNYTLSKVSGTVWEVPVTVTGSGSVAVTITSKGIEKFGSAGATTAPTVLIWKMGEKAKTAWTAVADGESNNITSTKITLSFSDPVTKLPASVELEAGNITIANVPSNAGRADKGTLTGSGATWTQNITVNVQGKIRVTITKDGIDSNYKDIDIFKLEGPPTIPEDGDDGINSWVNLAVDHSDDDPIKEAENELLGKGVITGADFDAIVDATQYKNTYLRLYLDLTAYTDPRGYGAGAVGNVLGTDGKPSGNDNLGFNSTSGTNYPVVSLPLKDLKKYYDVGDGEIFVNIWSGAKIIAIQLIVPVNLELEDSLPEGVTEFTLGEVDDIPGKGFFGAPDVAVLNAAKPGSYLEIYWENAPGSNWGVGGIMDSSWGIKVPSKTPVGALAGDSWVETITVAAIKYAFGVLNYDAGQKWANGTISVEIGLHPQNDAYVTKVWLYDVDDGEDPPPPEPPEFEAIGNLGDFTIVNDATQKGWASNGVDGVKGLAIDEYKAAKYIVLKVTDLESRDGIGGIQFIVQGDHDSWDWNQTDLNDWTDFTNDEEDITYVVIDLAQIDDWTSATADGSFTQAKVIIGEVQKLGTLLGAWLLADDPGYIKPGFATDFTPPSDGKTYGYIVAEADFDWELPADIVPMLGNLGDFTQINSDEQKGWNVGSNPSWDTVNDADYIVLKAVSNNRWGIGGVQFAVQGNGQSWAQDDLKEWTDDAAYYSDADQSFYFVIDLSAITGWADFISGSNDGWAQIFIGGIDQFDAVLGAWIIDKSDLDLDIKPVGAIGWADTDDFTYGYIVREDNWTFSLPGDI